MVECIWVLVRGGKMTKPILSSGFGLAFLLCGSVLPQNAAAQEYQWWNKMVGATKANQDALGDGSGVRVGVIDGLADWTHPEFGGRLDKSW
jgi:hypothetical protein